MQLEKVIVTGGSGRLGRHVVDALASHCAVSILDRQPSPRDAPFFATDILDPNGLAAAFRGQDAVIHLAGYDDGDAPQERAYIETNVLGAWNVFQAAEDAGLRKIVVASSTATLGLGYDRAPDYLPIDEDHPLRTTGSYGLGKQVIETMARHYVARGALEVVCLRPTLILRPEKEAAVLTQLALPDPDSDPPDGFLGPDGTVPYGALSATRSYVRSRDAAACFRLALTGDTEPFEVFNVAARDGIGRARTLDRLRRVYGTLPALRDSELYEADPYAGALDSRRARERLGWEPQGDWRDVAAAHSSQATTGAPS